MSEIDNIDWSKFPHKIKSFLDYEEVRWYHPDTNNLLRIDNFEKKNLYDDYNRLIQSKSTFNGYTEYFKYDLYGNIIKYTNSNKDVEVYKYDWYDRPIYAYSRKKGVVKEKWFSNFQTEQKEITEETYEKLFSNYLKDNSDYR